MALTGGKIWLWESPYTYVRTRVMRTLLVPKEDYAKLMRMSLPEISSYLLESTYRPEITELGVKYSGMELIDQALPMNFRHSLEKLRRISPEPYTQLIDAYQLRFDVDNLKTLIRAKIARLSADEARRLIVSVGVIRGEFAQEIYSRPSLDEMILALPKTFVEFQQAYDALKEKTLASIETKLEHFYFRSILDFARRIPREGKLFRTFLLGQIHHTNIMTFLRLRREKFDKDEQKQHLFLPKRDEDNAYFERLFSLDTDEEILAHLSRKFPEIKSLSSLADIEIALHASLYRKTVRFEHQNPLSVYAILSYLFAKELEMQNIKKIVKAKHLGIDMAQIEPQVIA